MGSIARPLQELIDRLTYHTTDASPARILDGVKFRQIPEVRTDAVDTFPQVALLMPTSTEAYRPTSLVMGKETFQIQCSVRRKTTSGNGLVNLATLVEKTLDAIDTNTSGVVDTRLDGTLKPFEAEANQSFALDLALVAVISVTVELKPVERGNRRT